MSERQVLSACGALVRRHDNDRFLTALFAPGDRREALFALYAFNHEVAKTREVVSETLLGQIRLQWWREAIEQIYAGTVRPHEVVEPLAAAIARHNLPRAPFDELIDAREADLTGGPPATMQALERYADASSGPLIELALHVLDAADAPARKAARHVGSAWALAGLARAVPFHARAKRRYLPDSAMVESGARETDLFELRPTPALAAAVAAVAATAREHLRQAEAVRPRPPRAAMPALLPMALAARYLKRLARIDHDVLARSAEISKPARQMILLRASFGL